MTAGQPPVTLAEYGPPVAIQLDDRTGRALASSGLVEAAPDPYRSGWWQVTTAGKVGVATVTVPGGDPVVVRIVPKVPIARLLFLLGYARDPKGWRDDDVLMDRDPGLVPVLARMFERQADRALRQGLLQGYRTTDETALVVRGRIREAEQIRVHHGRLIPLEITHDEFTADVPENRLLRTACDRLCRLPAGIPADVRGRLLRLRARLADITPIERGHQLPQWRQSRLNARYHNALRLAELVLRGASVEHRPGGVTVSGFIVNMAKVFEDFVTVALREALTGATGHCVLQASHHLDERRTIRMVPDFVRYTEDGTPLAVADAKYKAGKPGGFPDADLYQMLAYCTALNLPDGHLIYAKGNAAHTAHRIRRTGITIHQHALDLDQPPQALLTAIRTLARDLAPDLPS